MVEVSRLGFLPAPEGLGPASEHFGPPTATIPGIEEGTLADTIRRQVFDRIDRSRAFDFSAFRNGRPVDARVDGTTTTHPTLWQGRGFAYNCKQSDTICKLFRKDIWQQEQKNLRQLLRFTPAIDESVSKQEALFAADWLIEVATSIVRMKTAINFTNTDALDTPIFDRFWYGFPTPSQPLRGVTGSDEPRVPPKRDTIIPWIYPNETIWSSTGHLFSGTSGAGARRAYFAPMSTQGIYAEAPSTSRGRFPPWLTDDMLDAMAYEPPNTGANPVSERFAFLWRDFVGVPGDEFRPRIVDGVIIEFGSGVREFLATAIFVQPLPARPVYPDGRRLETTDFDTDRVVGNLGVVGGAPTVALIRSLASRYATLEWDDALLTCFSDWLSNNFTSGGIPKLSAFDSYSFDAKWNKLASFDIRTKQVSKSELKTDIRNLRDRISAAFTIGLQASQLERVIDERNREATNVARDGQSDLLRRLDQIQDALEAAAAIAPPAIQDEIAAVATIIEEARRLDPTDPEKAAEAWTRIVEATGDIEILGELLEGLTDFAEEVVDELREFGREFKQAAEEAFSEAVGEAMTKIAIRVGISAALQTTIVGFFDALLGGLLGDLVDFAINGFLEAIGLKERDLPPEPIPTPVMDQPLERWAIGECTQDFYRREQTPTIIANFFFFMADVSRVMDIPLGVQTRFSPLEPKECGLQPSPVYLLSTRAAPLVRAGGGGGGAAVAVGGVGLAGLLGFLLWRRRQQQQTSDARLLEAVEQGECPCTGGG